MIGLGAGLPGRRRAWTPARLGSQLGLWLRGDHVTLAGGTVSSWIDRSASGNNFAPALEARRPLYAAQGLAWRPALSFDGVDDILLGGSFSSLAGAGSAELFVVMQLAQDPPSVEAGYGIAWQLGSPSFGDEDTIPYIDGKIYAGAFSTVRKTTNVAMGAGYFLSPRIVSIRSAANDWRLSTDGVERYTTATNTFTTGGDPAAGGDPESAVARLYGLLAEVIVCAPVLSDADRARMLKYLGTRYSIAVP